MDRPLRSNHSIPEDFEIPEIVRDRIVTPLRPLRPLRPTMAAAPAPTEIWKANPHLGDFNPGTNTGAKIFEAKTKGLPQDKRLPYSRKESQTFRLLLQGKASTFGNCVTKIPIDLNGTGVIEHKNLIDSYADIPLERMIREAAKAFGTEIPEGNPLPNGPFVLRDIDPASSDDDKKTFYNRVHRHVVTEYVKNILDEPGRSELLDKMKDHAFVDATDGSMHIDGPTMLWHLLNKVDPSTLVTVDMLRQKIETARLHMHGNDVDAILTHIEKAFTRIQSLRGTCESILHYTVNALRSGPNDEFNAYIGRIKDDIESGTGQFKDITFDKLCFVARSKYNNMDAIGDWNKVDPRDAKMLALATEVESLKKTAQAFATSTNPGNTNPGKQNDQITYGDPSDKVGGVHRWRTVKNKGDSFVKDGVTFYWCDKHVHPQGLFNGLYCTHKPENHDEWKAKDRAWRKNRNANQSNNDNSNSKPQGLVVTDKLKEVLCSRLMLSDKDVENICKEANSSN